MTQQTLAERAGVALKTVSRIEAGEDARLETVRSIAAVLGLGVEITEQVA